MRITKPGAYRLQSGEIVHVLKVDMISGRITAFKGGLSWTTTWDQPGARRIHGK